MASSETEFCTDATASGFSYPTRVTADDGSYAYTANKTTNYTGYIYATSFDTSISSGKKILGIETISEYYCYRTGMVFYTFYGYHQISRDGGSNYYPSSPSEDTLSQMGWYTQTEGSPTYLWELSDWTVDDLGTTGDTDFKVKVMMRGQVGLISGTEGGAGLVRAAGKPPPIGYYALRVDYVKRTVYYREPINIFNSVWAPLLMLGFAAAQASAGVSWLCSKLKLRKLARAAFLAHPWHKAHTAYMQPV